MQELISIVIPVFNVSNYIKQSVDSVLAQTYHNLEIILVDDGSTDDSGRICDDYGKTDSRVRVIHKTNGGLSDARNAGIRIATGKYVGFVDSDDWIEPDMYEKLYASICDGKADIGVCGFFREYRNKHIKCCSVKTVNLSAEQALEELIKGVNVQDHACTKLFVKSLWEDIEFPVGLYFEDIRTIYRLITKAERVQVIGEPLYHYRQRRGSIVRDGFSEKKMQWLEAVQEQAKRVNQNSNKYAALYENKLLVTKGSLLREWFLVTPKGEAVPYYATAKDFYSIIREKRDVIRSNTAFPKSIKYLSVLSFFSFEFTRWCFRRRIIAKYFNKKYEYFE